MQINESLLQKIAHLSRLALTPEQLVRFPKELSLILGYIEKLQKVDTTDVPPTHQVTGLENVLRKDVVQEYTAQTELMDQAPSSASGQVKINKVL